jgi:hypothetical protein
VNTDLLNFHEDVLNDVLGVRGLAQDAPSRGEDHRTMLAHDPFPISGLAAGLAQAPVPGIGHRWFSRPCFGGGRPTRRLL